MILRRALLATGLATPALAQDAQWPRRAPIKLIVPFGSGGATDIVARVFAEAMGRELGQSIVVDNRPGAGATIGTAAAARSAPDGYTIAVSTISGMAVGQTLYAERVTWDADRDFAHIGMILQTPWILCVKPGGPIRSLADWVAASKRPPGLAYGTTGVGSVAHLLGVQLNTAAGGGVMEHIPYRSLSQSSADLLGGTIPGIIESLTATSSYIRDGSMLALASSGTRRSPAFPNIPTFSELGFPQVVAEGWAGLAAPAGTPRPILEGFARALRAAHAQPNVQQRLAELSSTPGALYLDDAQAYVRQQVADWAPIVRASGARPE
ncbi:tripartite tricarboxylate transporter substrate binding protein [Rhodovarius crocodyli]|uniref:Tripartite tricarboxylate transporter substrate binding protein n=1 Tax=Rhodovarius crocodyli TaxID=1979269 RepID=A0A437MLL5_9PROT|nr:tripartite tricarboxylate transporter substrate binding protein [Rhodovarius crocodyli]RVT98567.1 tripartite tricarboxylate transporter substrate binding protein [Rhodovarius crocodyli]